MLRKILKILGWAILGIFLVITLAFTAKEVRHVKCNEIEIFYDGQQAISIGNDEILKLINSADKQILEKELREINCETIEKEVEKNVAIENAEVYRILSGNANDFKGMLAVRIKHRDPVLRIISGDDNYFLDRKNIQIPVSTKYAANVMVATGKITPEFASGSLLPLVLFMEEHAFWKAQIEQIHVTENQELILVPLVGSHLIEFGKMDNYREKLKNLKAFYENVLAHNNWNTYTTINLKYKNLVIGTKR